MERLAKFSAVRLYARTPSSGEDRVRHFGHILRAAGTLNEAAAMHPNKVVFTTGLGAEDMVITDMIFQHQLEIELVLLDTGKLHQQTLDLITRVAERYKRKIRIVYPVSEDVTQFVMAHGEMGMRDSVVQRKGCCAIRKVEPLQRALAGKTAWITGMRQEQSGEGAEVARESYDALTGRKKYNPLAAWGWADVWRYIEANNVPYNLLHDAFFPSIGCEPCTRAVALGEDMRSGRWWWENQHIKECGPHPVAPARARSSMERKT